MNPKIEVEIIEKCIIDITGDDINDFTYWERSLIKRTRVEELLMQRCNLLNKIFQPTPKNLERFRKVNDYLLNRTQELHRRVGDLLKKATLLSDKDFDDDCEVEGWLQFVFNGEESVLRLDDDDYYGSRFDLMNKALYELYQGKGLPEIERSSNGVNNLDDGQSWMEGTFWKWENEFKDIVICHAVHDLTDHKLYSIPDLLRLNDFWIEAKILFQSITTQDGTRWKQQ